MIRIRNPFREEELLQVVKIQKPKYSCIIIILGIEFDIFTSEPS